MSESQGAEFVAYHGSPQKISKFSDNFLDGEDTTQHHGPGIYFTTNRDNARMFGKYVYTVKLSGNFISEDTPPDNIDVNELITLMKMSGDEPEDWEMEAQNYAEDPEVGIQMAAKSCIQYGENELDVFFRLMNSWYQYNPLDYVRNMTKMGYDGLIVDAPRDWVGDKHIIVFNPEIIQINKD